MSLCRKQEKSYYALRLPHGWWLFGLDLALVDDIDMCQCKCALLTPCIPAQRHMHASSLCRLPIG